MEVARWNELGSGLWVGFTEAHRDSFLVREKLDESECKHSDIHVTVHLYVYLTSVFLPGKSRGQSSSVRYSPCGRQRVRYELATKQQSGNNSLFQMTQVMPPNQEFSRFGNTGRQPHIPKGMALVKQGSKGLCGGNPMRT